MRILLICLLLTTALPSTANQRPQELVRKMFDAVDKNMFAKGYANKKMADVSGNLSVTTPPVTVSKQLQHLATDISFSLGFSGVLFPDKTHKLDFSGELGQFTMSRTANREILYSDDFNAYTMSRKHAAGGARSFASYFRGHLVRIRDDMFTSGRWSFELHNEVVFGAEPCYVVTVSTRFKEGDQRKAKARVQKVDDLITFWKRGRVTFTIRKSDFMPMKIDYDNPVQNIRSEIFFSYPTNSKRPVRADLTGNSGGIQGSGELSIGYDADGAIQSLTARFDNQLGQMFAGDISLNYRDRVDKAAAMFLPPMGAQQMHKDNLKLLMLTNVAGSLLRMQQAGINIKTLSF